MSTPQQDTPAQRQQDTEPPYIPTAQAPSMPSLTTTAPAMDFPTFPAAWAPDSSTLFTAPVAQGAGQYSPFGTGRPPASPTERTAQGPDPRPAAAAHRADPRQGGKQAKRR
ncbi:hypothetical protein [Streptomyces sp. NPDC059378]|uniref:hypothetical protein n=1 Tax=Streptomyces sp. NPDC059378 TaxID=3346815 RepID=UPI0036AA1047